MVRLQLEWAEPLDPVPSGYDLGHMTFIGDRGSCTSKDKTPDQAMMLVISFPVLFYGLEQLASRQLLGFTFCGIDSSFTIEFQPTSARRVVVKCRGTILDEVDIVGLCRSILSDVQAFMARPESRLPEGDPGSQDLSSSIARLVQVLERIDAK